MGEVRESGERPWLLLNMVTSIDGAVEIGGSSTALSDDDDRALFHALRAVPDVLLVGAGTVRAENYRPLALPEPARAVREARGMAPEPRLAIASGSLDLDPAARVFGDPERKPLVLTGEDVDQERLEALEDVADVARLESLDGVSIVGRLNDAKIILCEGGPTLNGHLLSAGVVDEINWTVAPFVAGGDSKTMAHGPTIDPTLEMRLIRVFRGDRSLFLRYTS